MNADQSDPRDYILDVSGVTPATGGEPAQKALPTSSAAMPRYLSIHFKCCQVYAAIYRNAAGTAYAGHCPRCKRAAEVRISPHGTRSRIFSAG